MKFNKLIPEFLVSDISKSLEFYVNVLGFKVEYSREEDKFVFLSFEGAQIMVQERNGNLETGSLEKPFGRGINFQIEVKDVDALASKLKEHNWNLFEEVQENWYRKDDVEIGVRGFLVCDPDGYLIKFAHDFGERQFVQRGV